MIAYPIGDPIGSHRVCPNRPRIARTESVRISSFNYVGHFAFPTYEARHLRVPAPTHVARRAAMR